MAKNRKHQSAAVRFGPALKALVLCVIIGGAGVGYVWQKSQIDDLGRLITLREQKLGELEHQNAQLRGQFATLCTPGELIKQVRKFNLGMALPPANQVWPLQEPMTVTFTVNAPDQEPAVVRETGLVRH